MEINWCCPHLYIALLGYFISGITVIGCWIRSGYDTFAVLMGLLVAMLIAGIPIIYWFQFLSLALQRAVSF